MIRVTRIRINVNSNSYGSSDAASNDSSYDSSNKNSDLYGSSNAGDDNSNSSNNDDNSNSYGSLATTTPTRKIHPMPITTPMVYPTPVMTTRLTRIATPMAHPMPAIPTLTTPTIIPMGLPTTRTIHVIRIATHIALLTTPTCTNAGDDNS